MGAWAWRLGDGIFSMGTAARSLEASLPGRTYILGTL